MAFSNLTQRAQDMLRHLIPDYDAFVSIGEAVDKNAGLTAGTVAASSAISADANLDVSGIRNQTNIGVLSLDKADTTDGVVNLLVLQHSSSDNAATALDGVGISFELENATGTSTVEEWASLDILSTTITNGSEDGDAVLKLMCAGTVAEVARWDSSGQAFNIGRAAGAASSFDKLVIYNQGTNKGEFTIKSVASTGNFGLTMQNADMGQDTVFTIPDPGSTTADIVALAAGVTTDGELKRADLTEEALVEFPIPLHSLRAADGATLGVADVEDSGDHYLAFSANIWKLMGNSPNSDDQTDVSIFQVAVPESYVAAGDIKIRVNAQYTVDGDEKTVDVEVYEAADAGTIGADLVSTEAATLTGSAASTDFVVDGTSIVAGDRLNVKITTVFGDDNGTDGEAQINHVALLCDIKG